MRGFVQVLSLQLRALWRSRALAILASVSVAWMFALPRIARSDGTVDGARQLVIRYALGGVFALVLVTLAAAAAGSLSKDRATRRLALTQVRPVRYFTVAFGRFAAFLLSGAATLALAAAILYATVGGRDRVCDHVLAPVLESPRAEAEKMYEVFMADPDTPKEAKLAKKSVVLRLLTQKAVDHYQTVPVGATATWRFRPGALARAASGRVAARLKFTNTMDTRDDVIGRFAFGGWTGSVSNITQAVVVAPLAPSGDGTLPEDGELSFVNEAGGGLMLRPRRDVNLLIGADTFGWNLFRAWCQLVSALAVVLAFATFLGACLGRSVAVFTVLAILFVSEVGPGLIEQYPDQLETSRRDRIGLALMRGVGAVTRPFGALHPLESLACDECVEPAGTLEALAVDAALLPLFLCLAAALAMPRKQE